MTLRWNQISFGKCSSQMHLCNSTGHRCCWPGTLTATGGAQEPGTASTGACGGGWALGRGSAVSHRSCCISKADDPDIPRGNVKVGAGWWGWGGGLLVVSCHLEHGFCRNRGRGKHPGQAPRWRACPHQTLTWASQCWTQAERCSVSHPLGNEPVFFCEVD